MFWKFTSVLLCAVFPLAALNFKPDPAATNAGFITEMYRDSSGYLWIGSQDDGLIRNDGIGKTQFLHDPKDPNSIGNARLMDIQEDHRGNLWVATQDCISRFISQERGFENYFPGVNTTQTLSQQEIFQKIYLDNNYTLWVVSDQALYRYNELTDAFQKINKPNSCKNLYDFVQDNEGKYWVLSNKKGLFEYHSTDESFQFYQYSSNQWGSSSKQLFLDSLGEIWTLSRGEELIRFTPSQKQFHVFPIDSEETGIGTNGTKLTSICELDDGRIVIGLDQKGLNIYDPNTETFEYVKAGSTQHPGLKSNGILSLIKDNEGILWVGTSRDGLFYSDPSQSDFESFNEQGGSGGKTIPFNVIGVFYETDDGTIWIGTDGGGLLEFSPETQAITQHRVREESPYSSIDVIRSIDENETGNLWISTWSDGFLEFDPKEKRFITPDPDHPLNKEFKGVSVWSCLIDSENRYWVASRDKIHMYDGNNGFQHIATFFEELEESQYVNVMMWEQPDGSVYVTGHAGVYQLLDDKTLELIIPVSEPFALAKDHRGYFYVGTRADGVHIFDADRNPITHLTKDNGLPENPIYSLQIEDENNLWVATKSFITKVPLDSLESTGFFGENDGIKVGRFFRQSSLRSSSGRLYFGGNQGFTTFTPSNTRISRNVPTPLLAEVRVFDQPIEIPVPLLRKTSSTKRDRSAELQFSHEDRMISFRFVAPHFTSPQKLKYSYMLKGLDSDWYTVDSLTRVATYTNLQPGKYVFKVRVALPSGTWNENELEVNIYIKPPFWRTKWFFAIAAILIQLIAWSLLRARDAKHKKDKLLLHQRLKEKSTFVKELTEAKDKAERADKLKSQFLANFSHEVRTPMNSIIGFSDLVLEEETENEGVQTYLPLVKSNANSLLSLINDILEISQIEANQINLTEQNFSLNELVQDIYRSLKSIQKPSPVVFECLNTVESKNLYLFADPFRLRQILSNLISNALKFTPTGQVTFKVEQLDPNESIQFSVIDTGPGMDSKELETIFNEFVRLKSSDDQAIPGVGLGLAICKQLTQLMGGELDVESTIGKGSNFQVRFPHSIVSDGPLKTNESAKPKVKQANPSWDQHRILIAEDNNFNAMLLERMLAKTGAQLEFTTDGNELIERFYEKNHSTPYDIILLDIQMPRKDGYQVIEEIRKTHSEQIIIAQTAFAAAEDRKKLLAAGFNDVLHKPIKKPNLMELLATYLDSPGG